MLQFHSILCFLFELFKKQKFHIQSACKKPYNQSYMKHHNKSKWCPKEVVVGGVIWVCQCSLIIYTSSTNMINIYYLVWAENLWLVYRRALLYKTASSIFPRWPSRKPIIRAWRKHSETDISQQPNLVSCGLWTESFHNVTVANHQWYEIL